MARSVPKPPRITTKSARLLDRLEQAVIAYADRGSQPPEDRPLIERAYTRARRLVELRINKLEFPFEG